MSNVFDGIVEYVQRWWSNVMHKNGTALQHIPTCWGITNTDIITSRRVVWLTGGQFLIGGCGCARWCSASGDKHSGIQGAWESHSELVKH